jgi:hypothetical protein
MIFGVVTFQSYQIPKYCGIQKTVWGVWHMHIYLLVEYFFYVVVLERTKKKRGI